MIIFPVARGFSYILLPYIENGVAVLAHFIPLSPSKTSNHLLGPKPFPLDRLLAIFYSVVDSRVAPTASVFSQISSLVTLQLLSRVSHDDQLDTPKYKCAVSLDFIRAIARTVGFDILRYLYDFL
ncbi:hypothetical protein GJAV_G00159490 [Gymnothorax javanicus]|nr:hypothetical protein GJAV_G00159490 [Gymnothorax javanicus]